MNPSERDLTIARDLLLAAGWDRDEFVKAIAEALVKARAEALQLAAQTARDVAEKYAADPASGRMSNRPERYGALEAWDAIRALSDDSLRALAKDGAK